MKKDVETPSSIRVDSNHAVNDVASDPAGKTAKPPIKQKCPIDLILFRFRKQE